MLHLLALPETRVSFLGRAWSHRIPLAELYFPDIHVQTISGCQTSAANQLTEVGHSL